MCSFFLQLKQRPFSINSDASEIRTHLALALVFPALSKLLDNLFFSRLGGFCLLLSSWLTKVVKMLTMALLTPVIWISPFESVVGVLSCSGLNLAVWGLEKKGTGSSLLNKPRHHVPACNVARTSFQFGRDFPCPNDPRLVIVIGKIYRN
jgi:hypothetical protein